MGWSVNAPYGVMGSRKAPANTAAIAEWLSAATQQSWVGAVIAIDTLVWGGLIPSRQSGTDLGHALAQLQLLRQLRAAQPTLPILAYSSIQRVSRDNDDAEEPTYYRAYGQSIFRRSQLEHRQAAGALESEEGSELAALRESIPEDVWQDQLDIRQRTAAVNLAALDLVEDGVIDVLVLNQDDTTVWGMNVMNRQRLEAEVHARNLRQRVLVYPGADEVAQVLLARLAGLVHGRRTLASTLFSSRGGPDVQTAYEDRPLGDLISVHLRAAGAVTAPPSLQPHWWLAVNSPSRSQGQGGSQYALRHGSDAISNEERMWLARSEQPVTGLDRSLETFRDSLEVLLAQGALVSLADVAHVNGADDDLMCLLTESGVTQELCGYGGWNTAGNALGSAVALGCMAALGADPTALRQAVAARLVDDWLYQARVRARLLLRPDLKPLGLGGFVADHQLASVQEQARTWVNDELERFDLPYQVTSLEYPWKRVFEISYNLEPAA